MKMVALILAALTLAGCATGQRPVASACPAGQDYLHTAQLFFGRNVGGKPTISETEFRKFVDSELTPRFPNGLTVLDGGAQWRESGDQLIREAQKVVLIALPGQGRATKRIEAVRGAYRTRFHQESILLIGPPSCIAF